MNVLAYSNFHLWWGRGVAIRLGWNQVSNLWPDTIVAILPKYPKAKFSRLIAVGHIIAYVHRPKISYAAK